MTKLFDWFMDFIYMLAHTALMLLPESPFLNDGFVSGLNKFSVIMSQVNYFIPFNDMFVFMGIYLLAVLVWYGLRWVLRFAKYID